MFIFDSKVNYNESVIVESQQKQKHKQILGKDYKVLASYGPCKRSSFKKWFC